MARVLLYDQQQLASERTPINSADLAGANVAQAAGQLAERVTQVVVEKNAEKQKYLDQSRIVKLVSEHATRVLEKSEQIKAKNLMTPDRAGEELQTWREASRMNTLDQVEDAGLRQELSFQLDRFDVEQKTRDSVWALQQTQQVTQQNYLDRIQADAQYLTKANAYEDFLTKVDKLEADRGAFYAAFGSIADGHKVVEAGTESMARAYVYGLLDRGRSNEAAALLESGKLDGFIDEKVKAEFKEKVLKAQKGDLVEESFSAFARAASENFEMLDGVLDNTTQVSEVEEKLSQVSFDLARESEKGEQANPDVINAYQKQMGVLSLLRDAKLEQLSTSAKDDPETLSDLFERYTAVFKTNAQGDYVPGIAEGLDEVLNFQQAATQAFYDGNISGASYRKWMKFTNQAISEELKGRGEGKFGVPGFFPKKERGLATEVYAPVMKDIFKQVDFKGDGVNPMSKQWGVNTFKYYLDEVADRTVTMGEETIPLSPQDHANILQSAKRKATLKELGYPIYTTVGSKVQTALGAVEVADFDVETGIPMVNFEDAFSQDSRIKTFFGE